MSKKPAPKRAAKKGAKATSKGASAKKAAPKKATAEKKPPKAATEPSAPVKPPGISMSDDQKRAIFLNHLSMLDNAKKAHAKTKKKVDEVKAQIKLEGGNVARTELGLKLRAEDEKSAAVVRSNELKARRDIEETITVARWVGSDLGQGQIDWLTNLQPATDRAFDEGKMAGLQALPRKPPYDPSVPQYKKWFEGYDEGQTVITQKLGGGKKASAPEAANQTPLLFEEPAQIEGKANPEPKTTGDGKKADAGSAKTGDKAPRSNKKNKDGTKGPPAGEKPASGAPAANAPQLRQEPPAETGPEFEAGSQAPPPPPPSDDPAQTELQMGDTTTKH